MNEDNLAGSFLENMSPLVIRDHSSEQTWDYENAFYWFSHPTRLNKLLAHYEIYKRVSMLPGSIFEFGVFKGVSLIRFATFRNAIENDFSRRIVGFDAFGNFPTENVNLQSDRDFISRFESDAGIGLNLKDIKSIIERKKFENIELIQGDVFDTLPLYLEKNPEERLALLHLDMDVMEPTLYVLDKMFDRIVPNGVIVFDDYNTVAGETKVVDQFLSKHKLVIEKHSLNHTPSYVIKTP